MQLHPRPIQSHARALLLVHVVWATHRRAPILDLAADAWLHRTLTQKAEALGSRVLSCGNAADHVHVLVRVPSTVSLSDLVQRLKGSSSHDWNTKHPRARLAWQSGYWAESVSPGDMTALAAYIRGQRKHHDHPAIESWEVSVENPMDLATS